MSTSLATFIKSQGWSDYGVVKFEKVRANLEKHEKIFEHWLSKGFHADLEYLENMKGDRYHPENKLADVESVIVLIAWYGYEQKNCSSNHGKVARYAAGRDYHRVLRKKLIELSDWLKAQNPLAQTYVSVDSGPMVDRVLAETAGIGYFGKNSMIINPSKGSYFFIASMLTNLDLTATPTRRMPNCGDCTRCIDKCPTGAIRAPGQIDAKRCISYLTIENKGGIPEEFRKPMGNKIFGCDDCQEVCPFNIGRAKLQTVEIGALSSEFGIGSELDLKEILSLRTDEQFLEKFAGTPLMRAKRRGLMRNACVVAGNSGNRDLIPYLQKVIENEEDEMLKEHAKWGIEQLEKTKVQKPENKVTLKKQCAKLKPLIKNK